MATEIKMPQLSDTMDAGKILVWRKKEGEQVRRGDVLAEVETDKANLEIEAFQNGTLLKILVPAEQRAKVGEVIAVIGEAGEQVAKAAQNGAAMQSASPAPSVSPAAQTRPAATTVPTSAGGGISATQTSGRVKASPLARKIAAERQIDLTVLRGSGPAGRIVRKDLEQSLGTAELPVQSTAAPAKTLGTPAVSTPTPSAGGTLAPMGSMRQTIARRMQESVTQAPHFYVTTKIRMNEALKLREVLKARPEFKGISVNHLVIKAAAYALVNEPRVNRAVKDGQVFTPAGINIGIITAVEDGLLIPVIKDTNTLPLRDLVFEVNAAIERARAGRPSSQDLLGGTFSISNMGMFDVENFTAIINPGQGAVLAVSSVHLEPIVNDDGQIIAGKVMQVTLSVDHRIIDGVMGATFLKHFKEALETPSLLLL
ncbi:MAG: dihydrolipoamide acetyltransferase family protein [Bdellovibrionota bacterium]|nr:MAG: dihydrolipoamide acetyltransferase family protein [Bdellovibrionota bacterium]